jgi:phenylalanyl-tRNA synthetase beta chain
MKVSLNWIKEFTDVKLPTEDLIDKIGAQLGAVEEVVETAATYEGALVVKVIGCVKHPNADKLSICLIDDGGVTKKIKRDAEGYIKVVCGAPNVAKGQTVVWLPPGSTVPATFELEPLVLEAREIRGVVSDGMIASARELALGDDHSGIVVIKENIKPGTPMIDAFKLDDTIIDIENKMFTHRPDLFGHMGIAREIAGIQQHTFKSPAWYKEEPVLPKAEPELSLTIKNRVPRLAPRFCAVAVANLQVGDSPMWLKTRLARLGIRPINNIVDITNLIMLETAQPVHAYDYDKLSTGTLAVRLSKNGEKLTLLGGKSISLKEGAVVITDGERPIGLGGVMGGADTEVDRQTKNIVIEVATFEMNQTRKTAMEHGLFTEAATRFTKNQSPRQNLPVLVRVVDEINKLAGGRVASPLFDETDEKTAKKDKVVTTNVDFINRRLGLNLKAAQMKSLLENVEFRVSQNNGEFSVTAPFWRLDIDIPEDIVEEIGRLYGYDHLPLELPRRAIKPAQVDPELSFKSRLRGLLAAKGANEVLTYSFVNEGLLTKAGQSHEEAFHIRNALSPDLQYYRLSLLPSLLEKVHPNIKAGYEDLSMFELGRGHIKGVLDDEKLPRELKSLAYLTAVKRPESGAAYYQAKWVLEGLLSDLGIYSLHYRLLSTADDLPPGWQQAAAPFEPAHSAVVYETSENKDLVLAIVGEPKNEVKQSLKLPAFTAMFEAGQKGLMLAAQLPEYEQLNRYPAIQQDITLRLPTEVKAGAASRALAEELTKISQTEKHIFDLTLDAIFQKPADKTHRHITWRLNLWNPERTLTTPEANKVFDMLEAAAKQKFKAERV